MFCLFLTNVLFVVCYQGYGAPRPPPSNGPPPPSSAPSNGPPYSGPGEYPPPPPPHPHGKAGPGVEGPEGAHPPPPPSKHEGPPASTWTPPVHNRQAPHAKVGLEDQTCMLHNIIFVHIIYIALHCSQQSQTLSSRVPSVQDQVPPQKR